MAIQSSYFVPQGGSVEPSAFANTVGDLVLNQEPPTTGDWVLAGFDSSELLSDNVYITVTPAGATNAKAILLWCSFTNEGGGSVSISFRQTTGLVPLSLGIAAGGAVNTSLIMPLVNGTFQVACDVVASLTGSANVLGKFGG